MRRTIIIFMCVCVFFLAGCTKKKDLSACDEKRKEIEEKYGITICYGDNRINDVIISELELCKDGDKIEKVLNVIEEYFSKLPKGFLEELTSMSEKEKTQVSVVVATGNYMGVSFETKGREYWVVNENAVVAQLAESNMKSIVYHIMNSDDVKSFMPMWKTYNPADFEYGAIGDNRKYLYGVAKDEECYFLIEESMEDVVNEMQAMFSLMWDEKTSELYNMTVLPKIDAKLQYLCSELDRVFETVDENAYWARYIKNKG